MLDFEKKFENITKKYNEIENSLKNQSGFESEKLIKLNKEYADLKPIVNTISNYKNELKEIDDLKKLLDYDDVSIKKIADEELIEKKKNIKLLEDKFMRLLIPKDKNDDKNSIL